MRRLARSLPTGPWTLKDLSAGKVGLAPNGFKVFSCFSGGGGSSMGYKLAGFEVVGFCEIDRQMSDLYVKNLGSPNPFVMPIQQLKSFDIDFEFDVLDGSPPCSSFSMAGNREKDWGKKKKFREGQASQILDDLFFHFIDLAKGLQPKVVVAENVKGLIAGNARMYVREIFDQFKSAGYDTQLFLLNAATMGVPQSRQRTFFIARRRDLDLPKLELKFLEPKIPCEKAIAGCDISDAKPLTKSTAPLWRRSFPGGSLAKAHSKGYFFTHNKLSSSKPSPTVVATGGSSLMHWSEPRQLSTHEVVRLQTFPEDYDFCGAEGRYVCGMSVPPLMMSRVAAAVAKLLRGAAD